MFHEHFRLVMLVVVSLLLNGTASFFVKTHFRDDFCLLDRDQIQSSGSWGYLSFLILGYKGCLLPSAQFRFRNNGAMLNLKKQGCVAAFNRNGSGENVDMFYLYVDSVSLDNNACAQKPNESIYRAITQTSEGGLSVYYKGKNKKYFETWQALDIYSHTFKFHFIGLSTAGPTWNHIFYFGSVTCHGEVVVNANCPKDQYMVVQTASYRGLSASKKCGLSDDYICKVDATCEVKKRCDGLHECNITVDDNLITGDFCPALSNYLYFEYQCFNSRTPYKKFCVNDVFLSYSSLPYKGVLQIEIDRKGRKDVCWESLNQDKADLVCRHLGYKKAYSFTRVPFSKYSKASKISYLHCRHHVIHLSQCYFTITDSINCPGLPYIQYPKDYSGSAFGDQLSKCNSKPPVASDCTKGGSSKLLLDDKQRFPDSSFSASTSSQNHSASNARASSGSSWCAPAVEGKNYLQVDLRTLYRLDYLVTYGDSGSRKWVTRYKLVYTIDLNNWKTFSEGLEGNKNAFNQAAEQSPNVITRAFRIIPLTYVGKPCIRVEFGGETVLPGKPTNLSITNITAKSAAISWQGPEYKGLFNLSQFRIKLKTNNSLLQDITIQKANEYRIVNLNPFTAYEISVTAGNSAGFGDEFAVTSFLTSEVAPSGTPMRIETKSQSATSLFLMWLPPEKSQRNGVIVSYTACISHSEYGSCFQTFITNKRDWLIGNLNASTRYYVRVLASTKVGPGNYSKSKDFLTNGSPADFLRETSRTLTFSLKIQTKSFLYFYVVALKLTNAQKILSPDNYQDIDLVTYPGMKNKTNPKPYVAAVFISSGAKEDIFVLGDGIITDDLTSRVTNDYFNGPLEPGTSYRIFQRIILNKKGDYYSTDWSAASKTSDEPDANENDSSEKYLFAIVGVLAILLVISFVIIAYLIYQIYRKSPSTQVEQETTDAGNNSGNVHFDVSDRSRIDASTYEEMGDEQSYTGLNRSGVEEYDDRSYAHLNHGLDVCVMQEESGV